MNFPPSLSSPRHSCKSERVHGFVEFTARVSEGGSFSSLVAKRRVKAKAAKELVTAKLGIGNVVKTLGRFCDALLIN